MAKKSETPKEAVITRSVITARIIGVFSQKDMKFIDTIEMGADFRITKAAAKEVAKTKGLDSVMLTEMGVKTDKYEMPLEFFIENATLITETEGE